MENYNIRPQTLRQLNIDYEEPTSDRPRHRWTTLSTLYDVDCKLGFMEEGEIKKILIDRFEDILDKKDKYGDTIVIKDRNVPVYHEQMPRIARRSKMKEEEPEEKEPGRPAPPRKVSFERFLEIYDEVYYEIAIQESHYNLQKSYTESRTLFNGKHVDLDAIVLNKQELIRKYDMKEDESNPNIIYKEPITAPTHAPVTVTESTGKQKQIQPKNFSIKIGINLDTKRYVVFRWGTWRNFAPGPFIIEVNLDEEKELGINPFTGNPYTKNPLAYHTVLRKLKSLLPKTNKVYYAVKEKVFVKLPSKTDEGAYCHFVSVYASEKQEKHLLKKVFNNQVGNCRYIEFFDQESVAFRLDRFLDYDFYKLDFGFRREFNTLADEMIKYGKFTDRRNLVEELIWGSEDPELKITRDNYKTGGVFKR